MNEIKKEDQQIKSSYPKGARVIAMAGAVLLVLMYIITLIAALTTSPASAGLFKACLGGSILLPIMLWLYIRFARLLGGKNEN
ncbi:MAG: hypothetical protein NC293_08780 [Roseburia sp.]|nr:hypothetical protein [Roseburia sp.]